ncbi:MAG: DUF3179 domain-containing protein [Acidobacteria bacterium]|nr:DUF3179 domain-containing protein [Acidobacteriota bacterium]
MSVVYGREKAGQLDQFGVSGYVYRNVFLIFDRRTESLWYPLDGSGWTAVSGPRKGETISFIQEPGVVTLGEWRRAHPDTRVLLGDKRAYGAKGSR